MRIPVTFVILFLFLACSNEKLDGTWYGQIEYGSVRYPVLVKFNNGYIKDYFSVPSSPDSVKYRYFLGKIYYGNFHGDKIKLKISLKDNQLIFINPKSDTTIVELKKPNADNFLLDYLNDKNLKIDLPLGSGIKRQLGNSTAYSYRPRNPLYLSIKNGQLEANFFDTTVPVDSNYYKFLVEKINSAGGKLYDWEKRITLIADKNIRITDLDLVKKQLTIAGYTVVDYMLKSNSYDKVNFFSSRLRELTEEEKKKYNIEEDTFEIPIYRDFDKMITFKNKVLIEINNGILKINNRIASTDEIKNIIDTKITTDPDLLVFYYLSPNSNYQDFIKIYDIVVNSIYDARDKKFGINDRNFTTNKKLEEAREKIPLIIDQLNLEEYNKIKNCL